MSSDIKFDLPENLPPPNIEISPAGHRVIHVAPINSAERMENLSIDNNQSPKELPTKEIGEDEGEACHANNDVITCHANNDVITTQMDVSKDAVKQDNQNQRHIYGQNSSLDVSEGAESLKNLPEGVKRRIIAKRMKKAKKLEKKRLKEERKKERKMEKLQNKSKIAEKKSELKKAKKEEKQRKKDMKKLAANAKKNIPTQRRENDCISDASDYIANSDDDTETRQQKQANLKRRQVVQKKRELENLRQLHEIEKADLEKKLRFQKKGGLPKAIQGAQFDNGDVNVDKHIEEAKRITQTLKFQMKQKENELKALEKEQKHETKAQLKELKNDVKRRKESLKYEKDKAKAQEKVNKQLKKEEKILKKEGKKREKKEQLNKETPIDETNVEMDDDTLDMIAQQRFEQELLAYQREIEQERMLEKHVPKTIPKQTNKQLDGNSNTDRNTLTVQQIICPQAKYFAAVKRNETTKEQDQPKATSIEQHVASTKQHVASIEKHVASTKQHVASTKQHVASTQQHVNPTEAVNFKQTTANTKNLKNVKTNELKQGMNERSTEKETTVDVQFEHEQLKKDLTDQKAVGKKESERFEEIDKTTRLEQLKAVEKSEAREIKEAKKQLAHLENERKKLADLLKRHGDAEEKMMTQLDKQALKVRIKKMQTEKNKEKNITLDIEHQINACIGDQIRKAQIAIKHLKADGKLEGDVFEDVGQKELESAKSDAEKLQRQFELTKSEIRNLEDFQKQTERDEIEHLIKNGTIDAAKLEGENRAEIEKLTKIKFKQNEKVMKLQDDIEKLKMQESHIDASMNKLTDETKKRELTDKKERVQTKIEEIKTLQKEMRQQVDETEKQITEKQSLKGKQAKIEFDRLRNMGKLKEKEINKQAKERVKDLQKERDQLQQQANAKKELSKHLEKQLKVKKLDVIDKLRENEKLVEDEEDRRRKEKIIQLEILLEKQVDKELQLNNELQSMNEEEKENEERIEKQKNERNQLHQQLKALENEKKIHEEKISQHQQRVREMKELEVGDNPTEDLDELFLKATQALNNPPSMMSESSSDDDDDVSINQQNQSANKLQNTESKLTIEGEAMNSETMVKDTMAKETMDSDHDQTPNVEILQNKRSKRMYNIEKIKKIIDDEFESSENEEEEEEDGKTELSITLSANSLPTLSTNSSLYTEKIEEILKAKNVDIETDIDTDEELTNNQSRQKRKKENKEAMKLKKKAKKIKEKHLKKLRKQKKKQRKAEEKIRKKQLKNQEKAMKEQLKNEKKQLEKEAKQMQKDVKNKNKSEKKKPKEIKEQDGVSEVDNILQLQSDNELSEEILANAKQKSNLDKKLQKELEKNEKLKLKLKSKQQLLDAMGDTDDELERDDEENYETGKTKPAKTMKKNEAKIQKKLQKEKLKREKKELERELKNQEKAMKEQLKNEKKQLEKNVKEMQKDLKNKNKNKNPKLTHEEEGNEMTSAKSINEEISNANNEMDSDFEDIFQEIIPIKSNRNLDEKFRIELEKNEKLKLKLKSKQQLLDAMGDTDDELERDDEENYETGKTKPAKTMKKNEAKIQKKLQKEEFKREKKELERELKNQEKAMKEQLKNEKKQLEKNVKEMQKDLKNKNKSKNPKLTHEEEENEMTSKSIIDTISKAGDEIDSHNDIFQEMIPIKSNRNLDEKFRKEVKKNEKLKLELKTKQQLLDAMGDTDDELERDDEENYETGKTKPAKTMKKNEAKIQKKLQKEKLKREKKELERELKNQEKAMKEKLKNEKKQLEKEAKQMQKYVKNKNKSEKKKTREGKKETIKSPNVDMDKISQSDMEIDSDNEFYEEFKNKNSKKNLETIKNKEKLSIQLKASHKMNDTDDEFSSTHEKHDGIENSRKTMKKETKNQKNKKVKKIKKLKKTNALQKNEDRQSSFIANIFRKKNRKNAENSPAWKKRKKACINVSRDNSDDDMESDDELGDDEELGDDDGIECDGEQQRIIAQSLKENFHRLRGENETALSFANEFKAKHLGKLEKAREKMNVRFLKQTKRDEEKLLKKMSAAIKSDEKNKFKKERKKRQMEQTDMATFLKMVFRLNNKSSEGNQTLSQSLRMFFGTTENTDAKNTETASSKETQPYINDNHTNKKQGNGKLTKFQHKNEEENANMLKMFAVQITELKKHIKELKPLKLENIELQESVQMYRQQVNGTKQPAVDTHEQQARKIKHLQKKIQALGLEKVSILKELHSTREEMLRKESDTKQLKVEKNSEEMKNKNLSTRLNKYQIECKELYRKLDVKDASHSKEIERLLIDCRDVMMKNDSSENFLQQLKQKILKLETTVAGYKKNHSKHESLDRKRKQIDVFALELQLKAKHMIEECHVECEQQKNMMDDVRQKYCSIQRHRHRNEIMQVQLKNDQLKLAKEKICELREELGKKEKKVCDKDLIIKQMKQCFFEKTSCNFCLRSNETTPQPKNIVQIFKNKDNGMKDFQINELQKQLNSMQSNLRNIDKLQRKTEEEKNILVETNETLKQEKERLKEKSRKTIHKLTMKFEAMKRAVNATLFNQYDMEVCDEDDEMAAHLHALMNDFIMSIQRVGGNFTKPIHLSGESTGKQQPIPSPSLPCRKCDVIKYEASSQTITSYSNEFENNPPSAITKQMFTSTASTQTGENKNVTNSSSQTIDTFDDDILNREMFDAYSQTDIENNETQCDACASTKEDSEVQTDLKGLQTPIGVIKETATPQIKYIKSCIKRPNSPTSVAFKQPLSQSNTEAEFSDSGFNTTNLSSNFDESTAHSDSEFSENEITESRWSEKTESTQPFHKEKDSTVRQTTEQNIGADKPKKQSNFMDFIEETKREKEKFKENAELNNTSTSAIQKPFTEVDQDCNKYTMGRMEHPVQRENDPPPQKIQKNNMKKKSSLLTSLFGSTAEKKINIIEDDDIFNTGSYTPTVGNNRRPTGSCTQTDDDNIFNSGSNTPNVGSKRHHNGLCTPSDDDIFSTSSPKCSNLQTVGNNRHHTNSRITTNDDDLFNTGPYTPSIGNSRRRQRTLTNEVSDDETASPSKQNGMELKLGEETRLPRTPKTGRRSGTGISDLEEIAKLKNYKDPQFKKREYYPGIEYERELNDEEKKTVAKLLSEPLPDPFAELDYFKKKK